MTASKSAFKKFLKNPLGLIGLTYIALVLVIGILAVPLSPDHSPNANQMHLAIAGKPPLFQVTQLVLDKEEKLNSWHSIFSGFTSKKEVLLIHDWNYTDSGVWVSEFAGEGAGGPSRFLAHELFNGVENPEQFERQYLDKKTFLFGTDRFGRDMMSRMFWGARVSLAVGTIAVFISLIIGIILGSIAGYFGGWVDRSVMWLINVVWSLPTLLLVIALSLALGKGFWQIFIAVGLSMWVEVARMVRGQVLSLRQKEYIESASVLGLGSMRVLFRHILPNISGPITVIAAANFAAAILLEAGLSFLGLGVQPPVPSWGQMIKEHYGYIILDSAYLAIIPGLAIMLLVMSFNFVGNALRDTLDVRLK